jgi:hypothetical protein
MSAIARLLSHAAGAVLAAALTAASASAQPVTLERDSPLYAEPRLDAAQTAQLRQGAVGEVVGKQGGWLNLKTAAGIGWLFSFNVRFPSQKAGNGESAAGSALGQVFGPRRSVSVASSIGIRGLEEEDLRQARFDAGQVKLLDDYAASKQAAEDAARAAGLASVTVEYLGARP